MEDIYLLTLSIVIVFEISVELIYNIPRFNPKILKYEEENICFSKT